MLDIPSVKSFISQKYIGTSPDFTTSYFECQAILTNGTIATVFVANKETKIGVFRLLPTFIRPVLAEVPHA